MNEEAWLSDGNCFYESHLEFFISRCTPLIRDSGSEWLSTSTLQRKGGAFVYNVVVPMVEIDCRPTTNGEVKKCAVETGFLHY